VQSKSKVLSKMNPPAFHTMKRRKYEAMTQNEDSKSDVSMNEFKSQSNGASETALSMVRFKDPSAPVFEYHHFVRRIQMGDFTILGATGAEVTYDLDRDINRVQSPHELVRDAELGIEVTRWEKAEIDKERAAFDAKAQAYIARLKERKATFEAGKKKDVKPDDKKADDKQKHSTPT